MADRSDHADLIARHALEGAPEQAVGLAGAVDVGGDDGVDRAVGRKQRDQPLLLERLAEVHVAPAAPGAQSGDAGVAMRWECHVSQSRCGHRRAGRSLGSRAVDAARPSQDTVTGVPMLAAGGWR